MASRPDAGRGGPVARGAAAPRATCGRPAWQRRAAAERQPRSARFPMRMDDLTGNADLEREEIRAGMRDEVRAFGGRDEDDEPGTLSPAARAELDEAFGYDRPAE